MEAAERHYLRVAEVARMVGVSASTVWRWIDGERLPAYRVGPRNIRIKREDLTRVIRPTGPQRPDEALGIGGASPGAIASIRPMTAEERRRGFVALDTAGSLQGEYPDWDTPEAVSAWVAKQRRQDDGLAAQESMRPQDRHEPSAPEHHEP